MPPQLNRDATDKHKGYKLQVEYLGKLLVKPEYNKKEFESEKIQDIDVYNDNELIEIIQIKSKVTDETSKEENLSKDGGISKFFKSFISLTEEEQMSLQKIKYVVLICKNSVFKATKELQLIITENNTKELNELISNKTNEPWSSSTQEQRNEFTKRLQFIVEKDTDVGEGEDDIVNLLAKDIKCGTIIRKYEITNEIIRSLYNSYINECVFVVNQKKRPRLTYSQLIKYINDKVTKITTLDELINLTIDLIEKFDNSKNDNYVKIQVRNLSQLINKLSDIKERTYLHKLFQTIKHIVTRYSNFEDICNTITVKLQTIYFNIILSSFNENIIEFNEYKKYMNTINTLTRPKKYCFDVENTLVKILKNN